MNELNGITAGKHLVSAFGKPTPKQAAFLKAAARYVGYGGAKGGGKSHAVRIKASLLAFEHPGISMLIVRRTLVELKENHVHRLLRAYRELPEEIRPKYAADDRSFQFPNGSRLRLGYCDSESDVLQYQGQEYDGVFLDEATQRSEQQCGWIDACVRGTRGIPKRTYLTCNPGGVGHAWVKRLFIDRDYRKAERARDYAFIPASIYDNAPLFAHDPGYLAEFRRLKTSGLPLAERKRRAMEEADCVRQLKNLPRELRRAWLEGDWNAFAGQYFSEFSEDTHVVEPFPIPESWRRSVALDYGLDMLAALWFAVDPSGQVYCYRSLERSNLTISAAAAALHAAQYETVEEYVAPPDLWNRRQDSGRSAAEIFADNGVPLVKAGNSRIDGWLCVKEYLRADSAAPRMRFFSSCYPILRALPLLQHDSRNVCDAATEPHDITHSPDALRYWCSRRQLLPARGLPAEYSPFQTKTAPPMYPEVEEEYLTGGWV
jgi:phage terminase large subunit